MLEIFSYRRYRSADSNCRLVAHVFLVASVLAGKCQRCPNDRFVDVLPQYPWAEPKATANLETALTTPRLEDISRIRARNALKIMLDVQGDISSQSS